MIHQRRIKRILCTDMKTERQFIAAFMVAVSNCSLYSKDHESVDGFARRALSILEPVLIDSFEIMMIANDLVINKTSLKDAGLQEHNLIRRMKRKHISRIDFLKGVTLSEIRQFIVDLSVIEAPIKAYPHIRTGTVDIQMKGIKVEEGFDPGLLPSFTREQIDNFKNTLEPASQFQKLRIAGLEEIVVNFIVTFKREANILKLLSPVKTYSDYTYTHGTNVAVLAMSQAESLGFSHDLVHDIGISGLLHDVGKLFISKDILHKEGGLDDEEFREITHHTYYGARYLMNVDNLTPLVPIAAMEHHMKYDCSGYPKTDVGENKQHICSQIIAVADFFDALRSHRPYRSSWEVKDILALMKKNSGTEFNPMLVDNFIRTMQTALA